MSSSATLNQVCQLIQQLTPTEQLEVLTFLSKRVGVTESIGKSDGEAGEEERRKHEAKIDRFLKMMDELAVEPSLHSDSAALIRQIREERAARL